MISQSTNDVVVVCSYGGTNLVKTGWNGSVHDTVPDLQTDLPFVVCLLLFVLVVGLVFDEREAFVVVLVVDVGVVETHELAGTTVVFTVELVCVLPFESIEITSDSITDVIELHDVVDFFDGFTVDFVVDVGVVETHELAGTTVVIFVELVCLLPFESVDTTSVSITDVIELHDFVCLGVVIERHELSSTIVVNVVALVCVRPFESTTFVVDAITDGTVWHDFLGLGLGVVDDWHDLFGMVINDKLVRVPVKLPFESVIMNF